MATLLFASVQSYAQIKPTPADERLKGMERRKLLEQKSLLKDVKFRNIGPSIMGGRVADIEANPADPTEFYVAYATGGLWHTVNNGQSFNPIFDNEQVIGIGDIAVNWTTKTIWVGTGEVNSSRSTYAGVGVYKSSNNGKTWEYAGLPESHHIGKILLHPTDPNTAWVAVLGHLYSPNKERGVYKTTDGGKTWKQTLFIDDNTGCVDMDINPANPGEVYASMWYRTRRAWNFEESGKTSGLYKSADGGNTWQNISAAGSGFINGDGFGRSSVAVYAKNPQIVYAVVDNQFPMPDTSAGKPDTLYKLNDFKNLTKEHFAALDDKKLEKFMRSNRMPQKYTATAVKDMVKNDKVAPTAVYDYLYVDDGFQNKSITGCEVYRSDDAGKSWKKTHIKPIGIFNTYGYYFGKIFVSPQDENKVFILGFYAQMSTDGGKTFKTIDKNNVHPDHHALWINPAKDSHIINGNDGGLNISYDNGEHWFKANTPPVGQYYAITVDNAKPYNVYGGLQDNGSWYGPSNFKEDIGWVDNGEYGYKNLNGGDGMQAQVDTRDNATVYSGSQFGFYRRMKTTAKNGEDDEAKPSENNFNEEEEEENMLLVPDQPTAVNAADDDKPISVRPVHELGEKPLRFNWQTPILLSQHNQDVLYYGTNRFHRSLQKGANLEALSGDLTNGPKQGDVPFGTATTICESPLKFGLLYVGTDDGNVQISKDGGYTFTPLGKPTKQNTGLPQGLYISRVVASAWKESRVYVTMNGYRNDNFNAYVFTSEDYGNTWKQIGKYLPSEPVNVIREDPKSDSILYVGTDGGLYASIDAGNSFMMWNSGLPKSIPVHDIAIQKRENEIVVATHGRSLYVAKLDEVQKLLTDKSFFDKKKAEADKLNAVANGIAFSNTDKVSLNVDCPPLQPKKIKKKNSEMVVIK